MTYKEKLMKEHPERIDKKCFGGCWGCPSNYGYIETSETCSPDELTCEECWNREIPEKEEKNTEELNNFPNGREAKLFTDNPSLIVGDNLIIEEEKLDTNYYVNGKMLNYCPFCGRDLRNKKSEKEKKERRTLGSVECGETIKIGKREYVVLGHDEKTTAIITKEPTRAMDFGKDGDYAKSNVRNYCNSEFYAELCRTVGKENIVRHLVELVADDGSGKGMDVMDYVSILTNDLYRHYREFIPIVDSYWTATRLTTLNRDFSHRVCFVNSNGILTWEDCDCFLSVRPFCILDSNLLIF